MVSFKFLHGIEHPPTTWRIAQIIYDDDSDVTLKYSWINEYQEDHELLGFEYVSNIKLCDFIAYIIHEHDFIILESIEVRRGECEGRVFSTNPVAYDTDFSVAINDVVAINYAVLQ